MYGARKVSSFLPNVSILAIYLSVAQTLVCAL